MKKSKFMAILLTLVLTLSMANGLVFNVSAASPKLNKKKVTITVGKTVKLKVKKNKAKKKVKWKSANKKIVKVTKKLFCIINNLKSFIIKPFIFLHL